MYNFLFCINESYAKYLEVLVFSIIKNTKRGGGIDEPYVFHIFHSKLSTKCKENFKILEKKLSLFYPCKFKFYFIDEALFKNLKPYRNSFVTYFRLQSSRLIKGIDKLLYLDVDMLVLDDLREIFSIDLKDKILAAVFDIHPKDKILRAKDKNLKDIKIPKDYYFNAGLLLINLKEIARLDFDEILYKYDDYFVDQDVLNALCFKKIFVLPLSYNFMIATYKKHFSVNIFKFEGEFELNYTRKEFKDAKKKPKIIHYTSYKPWENKYKLYYYLGLFLPILRFKQEFNANFMIAKAHRLWLKTLSTLEKIKKT